MNRAKLKSTARHKISGKNNSNFIILFAFALLATATLDAFSIIPVVGSLAAIILAGPTTLSLTRIHYGFATKRQQPKFEDLTFGFSDANFLRALATYLLRGLLTFLWSLLLVVPGIVKSLAYSQAFFLLATEPKLTATESLKKSSRLMQGHKLEYLTLQLSFLPWHLLAVLTCGVLYIWLLPYIKITNALYFNQLSPAKFQPKKQLKRTSTQPAKSPKSRAPQASPRKNSSKR